jgi:ATP-dependent Zn protease
MSNNTAKLVDLLANWFPMLLLIAVWFFFMRQMRGQLRGPDSPQQQALAEQKRHNEALEKILAGHEGRLQKLEGDRRGQISN